MAATAPTSPVLLRAALIATLALGAVVASPAAASASTIYPPSGSCTTTPATAQAGDTVVFACAAETFSADETVTITVTGENGADASIGMVRFAITTASSTTKSAADGSLAPIDITLPSNATGTYNIAAVSATSAGGTAAVSITGADGLPSTGLDQGQTVGLWIGGGVLLLAGAALAIVAAVRRRRDMR
ncbi:LPXTG cell wall anchor domain-containing protein [Microbacterium jejuense]|uniref:LPXTG cell wall anchor domain-containing protein n=1 Tax=Microbacterium jejuense TaxID=1263637 RepID=A0ABS7HMF0_9MICO|nr:LPXTG cell wall anchor domain-containing protein [Microbacterium jejuense]MBW9094141.1 LPXTG cell wall anchor domain-containing protein [Microbacterium jejuense]